MKTELETILERVNGKRRERLLDHKDLMRAAAKLKPGQHVFLHGGHVANAYRFPAYATGAVVFVPKGKRTAYVFLDVVSAKKGATGFGTEKYWKPDRHAAKPVKVTQLDKAKHCVDKLRGTFDPDTPWEVIRDYWLELGDKRNAALCKVLS